MKVLIVGRTKMSGNSRCIGGILEDGTSVRLLTKKGANWTTTAPFQIGEIWDIDYTPKMPVTAPHVEDILVTAGTNIGNQQNLRDHLINSVNPWQGGISQVFGGLLGFTSNHNGYISEVRGVPPQSTGFWIPKKAMSLRDDGKHYDYPRNFFGNRGMSYVGEMAAIPVIPAGTLVRVSLARWWKPAGIGPELEERCYLQLWGGSEGSTILRHDFN